MGKVILEGTEEGASTAEVQKVDITVEVTDKECEQKLRLEILSMCVVRVEEVGINNPGTGKVKVSTHGNVFSMPIWSTCGRRKNKETRRRN